MLFYKSRKLILVSLIQIRHKSSKANINRAINNLLIGMPQERAHVADAQRQRLRIKEKGSKYCPGTVSLQVLGSGAPGAPASVYLFTDQTRYLFNCGEGTQRLAHEHKTKLSRLEHIFLTRTSWSKLGGLPGLSLTVQDAGVPNLTLHGPPGLDELFRGMRRFVILKDLKVEAVNCSNGSEFDDQVLTVKSIPIRRKHVATENAKETRAPDSLETDETDYFSYESKQGRNELRSRESPERPVRITSQDESVAISYICKLKPKPGSLNLEKCVDKGITPGPLLGQLKNGFDVTLPDGTVVRSDEVRGESDPGPVFIFVDIPSEEFFESFEESMSAYEKHQATAENDGDQALIVVHFTPENIVQTELYQQFMSKFSPSTHHLVLNSSNKFSGYLAAHRIQIQLNQLNGRVFPFLKESEQEIDFINTYKKLKLENGTSPNIEAPSKSNKSESKTSNITVADVKSLTTFHLRPRKGLDRSNEPVLNPADYIRETHSIEGFLDSLANYRSKLKKDDIVVTNHFPKIVFLGTGSCIPNKTRNVSSILVHINESSSMLMDCGEGTWGQIVRFYGEREAANILRNLRSIYVSHLHADHHIGLIGLLKERQDLLGSDITPILLFAPRQIQSWLDFYNYRIEPIESTYKLLPNGDMLASPLQNDTIASIGLRSISTCMVRHCPHSFGVSMELDSETKPQPIKITYSGDTMPCNDLIELGMDSTILIHEATMEDELVAEAKVKMHSTVGQAIEQGAKMRAKYTILTHFSQRYAKLPRIESSVSNNVGIAFDNMQVTLDDMENLNVMYPTQKLMFAEHCEEMEQKALKRALKKERKRMS